MEQKPKCKPNQKLKLMDQVREVLRYCSCPNRQHTHLFYSGKSP